LTFDFLQARVNETLGVHHASLLMDGFESLAYRSNG
jgi:hypothetical protein